MISLRWSVQFGNRPSLRPNGFRANSSILKSRYPAVATTSSSPAKSRGRRDQPHNSLSTFLQYARTTSLSPSSTIYTGTLYEYTVLQSLLRLGIASERVGGVSDKGIDLLGAWRLPTLPDRAPLRVIVQCKALRRQPGPAVVRELEGAFAAIPSHWKTHGDNGRGDVCVGILAAPLEATKGVRDAMGRSRWPMAFAKINHDGRVEQLLWNKRASEHGLDGLSVTVRHLPRSSTSALNAGIVHPSDGDEMNTADQVLRSHTKEQKRMESEVVLVCNGQMWEHTEPELLEWYNDSVEDLGRASTSTMAAPRLVGTSEG